jgi:uncharacterized membrane protein
MENRKVGYLVIAIAALIAFIVYSFNAVMTNIISTACSHGPECPMWGSLDFQTNISLGVTLFVMAVGLYLIIFGGVPKPARARIVKPQVRMEEVTRENFEKAMNGLDEDERKVFGSIIDEKGSMFQSSLVEKTGLNKVRVSRVLDRLEGKGLLERKRRGMTNVVVLRH